MPRAPIVDADGRATGQHEYSRNATTLAQSVDSNTSFYYNTPASQSALFGTAPSAGGAGDLAYVQSVSWQQTGDSTVPGANPTTTTTYYHYQYWDQAKQDYLTIQGYNPALAENNQLWKPGISSYSYDVNGHMTGAVDAGLDGVKGTADDVSFRYVNNAQGIILRRDQMKGARLDKQHRYLYVNGQGVGDVGNDGDQHLDYAQQLAQARTGEAAAGREALYKNGMPIASADFDQNYQPINSSYPATVSTTYTVQSGDTLALIAARVWGDSSLWYLIADANGLNAGIPLTPGQVLILPNKVTNVHNSSTTFKPYDPGEAIGDTSPTLPTAPPPPPPPHHGKGCGGLGMIIVAIVTVVATIYTAGAAAEFMYGAQAAATVGAATTAGTMGIGVAALSGGSIAAAAIGGAVGSIAGQMTGMALGVQDSFSWGAVAAGALGAAAGAGVAGSIGQSTALGQALGTGGRLALSAAVSNTATQGINILMGQQQSFSWASVAVSAIAAPVAVSINDSLFGSVGANGLRTGAFAVANPTAAILAESTTTALVSATTRVAIVGGKLDWVAVSADALSSFVSSRISRDGAIQQASERGKLDSALKELDIVKADAKAVSQAFEDQDKVAQLRSNGYDPTKLRATYVADLASGDVYLDYKSKDIGNADKVDRMKEALGYFGVNRLSDEQLTALNIDSSRFVDEKSGYFAALYKDDKTGGYLLANRGTESVRDLVTDIKNNFGSVDAQFDQAVKLARILGANETVGANLTFTGHSLGGGLASAQAAKIEGNAITFNSAGLTDRVAENLGLKLTPENRARIEANYLRGDLVSVLQDSVLVDVAAAVLGTPVKYAMEAVGLLTGQISLSELNLTIGSSPEAFGTRHMIEPSDNNWSALTRHYNNSILRSLTDFTLSAARLTEH